MNDNLTVGLDEDVYDLNYDLNIGESLRFVLRISSYDEVYSFCVPSQFVLKSYPGSMLATMLRSKGEWIDKYNIKLPFDAPAIVALERYFHQKRWFDWDKRGNGGEYVMAVNVLHYLSIPLIVSNGLLKYVRLPKEDDNSLVTYVSKMMTIRSEVDGHSFEIDKSLLSRKFPKSMLSTAMRGPWVDHENITLPYSKETLISLEYYLKTDVWIVTRKLRSGNDLYETREVLDYLMIPYNEKIEYMEDILNPYSEVEKDTSEEIDEDFLLWEEEESDDEVFDCLFFLCVN